MKRFAQLYSELDATTRTNEKLAALERYFASAEPADAAWALYFLTGNKIKRVVNTRLMRDWLSEVAGLPLWLVEESYDTVGDLAETLALLCPAPTSTVDWPLRDLVAQRVVPLASMDVERQRQLIVDTWKQLDAGERFVWHKLIMGEFRVGVARTLVARALAKVAEVSPEVMAHRLMGHWQPTPADYRNIVDREGAADNRARPYPFFLATQLDQPLEKLGSIDQWQIEWKWDGIRGQLIHRGGDVLLWSRGEELVTDRYPEVAGMGSLLPDGTVLDGELLAWEEDAALPFAVLQRRIGRQKLSPGILRSAPVAFMAYDLLEHAGDDIRSMPLADRRALLERLYAGLAATRSLQLSQLVVARDWPELAQRHTDARALGVEGMMLKRRDSAYGVGRPRGDWWKWKSAPLTIDAVLIYAQRGHGRRASLYSDYTFGVWNEGELVPVAKAYSGLTDAEMLEVDAFVRRNTTGRFGPLRVVRPELVFELHFEGIQVSSRHKAGLAVRFPRIGRQRFDKPVAEADSLDTLRRLAAVKPAEALS